ncbi:MAG: GGDEF domain-containing protein [Ruminococcus sp.]|nr:GGDEF domain-containing protein [Ruminococcus sp.]
MRDVKAPLNKNLLIFKFNTLLKCNILDFIYVDNLNFVLSVLCDKAVSISQSSERKEEIYRIFMEFYKEIISFENLKSKDYSGNIKGNVRYANSIIGNMIDSFQTNSKTQLNIMQSLKAMNIRSSYLYLHENTVISKSRYDYVQPAYEMLSSCHIGDKFRSFSKGKKVKSQYLFRNDYMPDSRFTFIASPVFCSEENYGLLLLDIDTDDYNFYNSIITSQLSYAIKLRNMLEEQKAVQTNLRESLSEATSNNVILNKISKSDELTGVYNRRGFMENVVDSIKKNCGKRAAIIYADMDKLKQINDIFGHDEGDYAIKKAAEILGLCMRTNDIIARFGGDEFAAFALIHENDFSTILYNRIEDACTDVNNSSDKPYNINISVGVCEFICSSDADLTTIMNEADKHLYENKRYKNVTALKNPEDIHKMKK